MSEASGKKYVVRLSAEERQTLEALISKGKHPAALVLKARVLLKADVSEAGEGWSDSRIVKALDVSPATIYRTRQRLVEEGFEAVLARKHSPNSARPRIFDGAAEAKLIALMCSPPPKGRAKWTLRLLEDTVVELNIVARASDNTIGRTLKKTISVRQAKLAWSSRWKSGEGKAVARRPVASVAWTSVTAIAKRTQQSCGVGY